MAEVAEATENGCTTHAKIKGQSTLCGTVSSMCVHFQMAQAPLAIHAPGQPTRGLSLSPRALSKPSEWGLSLFHFLDNMILWIFPFKIVIRTANRAPGFG